MNKEKYIVPQVLSVRPVERHGFLDTGSAGAEGSNAGDTPEGPGGVNDDDLGVKGYSGFEDGSFVPEDWNN